MVAVASHDTASAVIASPLNGSRVAHLLLAPWSLMGFESQTPFTNDTALAANITNEGGAEGRYRVLKNIMGLWLLQRVLQERQINDFRRLSPQHRHFRPAASSSIPMTIALLILTRCAAKFRLRVGKRRNRSRKVMLNWRCCIFDSLALLYADVLHEPAQLRGEDFSQLDIVGGRAARTRCSTSYVLMPAVFG